MINAAAANTMVILSPVLEIPKKHKRNTEIVIGDQLGVRTVYDNKELFIT